MHTGQYYYDHLPQRIKQQFLKNCTEPIHKVFSREFDSLQDMIQYSFTAYFTKEGSEHWKHVAQEFKPSLKTKTTRFVEKHAWSTVVSMLILSACSVGISICTGSNYNDTINVLNEDRRIKDSIIHSAEHIDSLQDSIINRYEYLPDTWSPTGAITLDSANKWMDKVMDENKIQTK